MRQVKGFVYQTLNSSHPKLISPKITSLVLAFSTTPIFGGSLFCKKIGMLLQYWIWPHKSSVLWRSILKWARLESRQSTSPHALSHSRTEEMPLQVFYRNWLPLSETHSFTLSCLVNLIYVTLTCEDNNSKLVVIVTIADAENCFDDSLVQIWKLKWVFFTLLPNTLWGVKVNFYTITLFHHEYFPFLFLVLHLFL